MARWTVVVQCGGTPVARVGAPVAGHTLACPEDLDGGGGQPRPQLLADHLVRDGIVVALEPDMVIGPDTGIAGRNPPGTFG